LEVLFFGMLCKRRKVGLIHPIFLTFVSDTACHSLYISQDKLFSRVSLRNNLRFDTVYHLVIVKVIKNTV
jgi:hypothetical protein